MEQYQIVVSADQLELIRAAILFFLNNKEDDSSEEYEEDDKEEDQVEELDLIAGMIESVLEEKDTESTHMFNM